MKNLLTVLALSLAVGCTEVNRPNNYHDLDGMWSSDISITTHQAGVPDETESVEQAWISFDQSGPSVDFFGYAGHALDDRARVDSKKDVYLFGPWIMAKAELEGDVSRDGGELVFTQDVRMQGDDGEYQSIGVVDYIYTFGPLTPVVDGEVLGDAAYEASREPVTQFLSRNRNSFIHGGPEENTDYVLLQEPFTGRKTFLPLGRKKNQ